MQQYAYIFRTLHFRTGKTYRVVLAISMLSLAFSNLSCTPTSEGKKTNNPDAPAVFEGVPPLVPEIVNLDLQLLQSQEADLRRQLQATTVAPSLLQKATTIAMQAREPSTRLAAIRSIGQSSDDKRKEVLMQLFETLKDEEEKSAALRFIDVQNLTSPEAIWMIEKLNTPTLSDNLKAQMVELLVYGGWLQNKGETGFATELQAKVPAQWRDAIAQQIQQRTQWLSE